MSIDDYDIDLTQGHKFCKPRQLQFSLAEELNKIPWKVRPVVHEEDLVQDRLKYKNDPLSSEVGCTIRSISTGHIVRLFAPYHKQEQCIMDDILLEIKGIFSDYRNYICPKCGKIFSNRSFAYFYSCPCEFLHRHTQETKEKLFTQKNDLQKIPDGYIPWMDYRYNFLDNTIIGTERFFKNTRN